MAPVAPPMSWPEAHHGGAIHLWSPSSIASKRCRVAPRSPESDTRRWPRKRGHRVKPDHSRIARIGPIATVASLSVTLSLGSLVLTSLFPSFAAGELGAASAAPLSCSSSSLVVTWYGTTGGLAGHGGDLFWVRNVGSRVCRLVGYPLVSYETRDRVSPLRDVDTKGRGFYGPVGIGPRQPLPLVELAPHGGLASFWVFGEDVQPPCPALPYVVVEFRGVVGYQSILSPPGYAAWPFCGTQVEVMPVTPGALGSLPPMSIKWLER